MGKIGYNISEAAKAVGMSERAINSAINQSTLSAYRLDDHCVILADDIAEWIRSHPQFLADQV